MLKKVLLSAVSLLTLSICAADLTEVFKIDSSSALDGAEGIEKKADGFEFTDKSLWKQPISFNPANAEIELDAVFNLTPPDPAAKRKYNLIYRVNDVNRRQVGALLIVQYPNNKRVLVNFTIFTVDKKPVVCQKSMLLEMGVDHSINVQMTKEYIALVIDGKVANKVPCNAELNAPATIIFGNQGGNNAANMLLKKFTVKSN